MRTKAFLALAILCFVPVFSSGQQYPDKIRGYKVYTAKILIQSEKNKTGDKTDSAEAFVKLGEPKVVDLGIFGVTFELTGQIGPVDQRGVVDMVTFSGLRLNGIPVEAAEYGHSFELSKDKSMALPGPFRVYVKNTNIARAAFSELLDPKRDWLVTGTAFVFGRFKKFGFTFKRVVPVPVSVRFKNPLR